VRPYVQCAWGASAARAADGAGPWAGPCSALGSGDSGHLEGVEEELVVGGGVLLGAAAGANGAGAGAADGLLASWRGQGSKQLLGGRWLLVPQQCGLPATHAALLEACRDCLTSVFRSGPRACDWVLRQQNWQAHQHPRAVSAPCTRERAGCSGGPPGLLLSCGVLGTILGAALATAA
jgi:hypothetical protein